MMYFMLFSGIIFMAKSIISYKDKVVSLLYMVLCFVCVGTSNILKAIHELQIALTQQ